MKFNRDRSNFHQEKQLDLPQIWFDGAAQPSNPGYAAGAAVILLPGNSNEQIVISQFVDWGTCNQAEYSGLIVGLEKALELKCKNIQIFGDSKLVISQVDGSMSCKAENLLPLLEKSRQLLSHFETWQLCWIPRKKNSAADAAATNCIYSSVSEKIPIPGLSDFSIAQLESLPVAPPLQAIEAKIKSLTKMGVWAHDKYLFELKIPSGSDSFSRMRLTSLQKKVPKEVNDFLVKVLGEEDSKQLATALRWWLRGLRVDFCIRKARVGANYRRELADFRQNNKF
ncbi:MAG: ribonuclease HI family protein [Prochloraceae cyanobacterium]